MSSDPLPEFEHPPVVETVLGVQFEPIKKLKNVHLGAFWKCFEEAWPNVSEASPLGQQYEQFGEERIWGGAGLRLQLTQELSLRLQMQSPQRDRMVQVQNGRFHVNWLGQEGGQYPRYAQIREEFVSALERFRQFLLQENVGDFKPNQWEVTYVNHIPKGSVWTTPDEWTAVFSPLLSVPCKLPSGRFEGFNGEWHFEIEQQRGRLHVQLKNGHRAKPSPEEIILLTLTARGPAGNEGLDLMEGLDLGHITIVKSFKCLTSDTAQHHWGLINA